VEDRLVEEQEDRKGDRHLLGIECQDVEHAYRDEPAGIGYEAARPDSRVKEKCAEVKSIAEQIVDGAAAVVEVHKPGVVGREKRREKCDLMRPREARAKAVQQRDVNAKDGEAHDAERKRVEAEQLVYREIKQGAERAVGGGPEEDVVEE